MVHFLHRVGGNCHAGNVNSQDYGDVSDESTQNKKLFLFFLQSRGNGRIDHTNYFPAVKAGNIGIIYKNI
jgi:hypothetical protein